MTKKQLERARRKEQKKAEREHQRKVAAFARFLQRLGWIK